MHLDFTGLIVVGSSSAKCAPLHEQLIRSPQGGRVSLWKCALSHASEVSPTHLKKAECQGLTIYIRFRGTAV